MEKQTRAAEPLSEKKSVVLKKLFFATLYLSAFTFGGGYVIVTLLKQKFVDELHWIDEEEMLDLVAIAQSSPGAIAVNGAIVVGYKLAGIAGVIVSVIGAILPPFIILTVISFFYDAFKSNFVVQAMLKGMNAGVAAVIISVVFDMGAGVVRSRDALLIAVMIVSFVLNKTMFGRSLYAIGGNEISAERAGYNVKRTKFILYTVVGALSGFVGMVRTCLAQQSIPKALVGKEMTIIPAVILGGASIFGGEGTVYGTMIAVGLITVVSNSMLLLGIGTQWQDFFNGLVILVGITVSAVQAKRQTKA